MKSYRWAAWCALLAIVGNVGITHAQTLFRTQLKDKYGFKIVSCNTCHVSGKPKTMRNDFGQLFADELAAKTVTDRLNKVKTLDRDDPKRKAVEETVTKEFHEALKKIEAMEAPGGGTYADALKAGEVDGITLK